MVSWLKKSARRSNASGRLRERGIQTQLAAPAKMRAGPVGPDDPAAHGDTRRPRPKARSDADGAVPIFDEISIREAELVCKHEWQERPRRAAVDDSGNTHEPSLRLFHPQDERQLWRGVGAIPSREPR